jgi:hypothetical protein
MIKKIALISCLIHASILSAAGLPIIYADEVTAIHGNKARVRICVRPKKSNSIWLSNPIFVQSAQQPVVHTTLHTNPSQQSLLNNVITQSEQDLKTLHEKPVNPHNSSSGESPSPMEVATILHEKTIVESQDFSQQEAQKSFSAAIQAIKQGFASENNFFSKNRKYHAKNLEAQAHIEDWLEENIIKMFKINTEPQLKDLIFCAERIIDDALRIHLEAHDEMFDAIIREKALKLKQELMLNIAKAFDQTN